MLARVTLSLTDQNTVLVGDSFGTADLSVADLYCKIKTARKPKKARSSRATSANDPEALTKNGPKSYPAPQLWSQVLLLCCSSVRTRKKNSSVVLRRRRPSDGTCRFNKQATQEVVRTRRKCFQVASSCLTSSKKIKNYSFRSQASRITYIYIYMKYRLLRRWNLTKYGY